MCGVRLAFVGALAQVGQSRRRHAGPRRRRPVAGEFAHVHRVRHRVPITHVVMGYLWPRVASGGQTPDRPALQPHLGGQRGGRTHDPIPRHRLLRAHRRKPGLGHDDHPRTTRIGTHDPPNYAPRAPRVDGSTGRHTRWSVTDPASHSPHTGRRTHPDPAGRCARPTGRTRPGRPRHRNRTARHRRPLAPGHLTQARRGGHPARHPPATPARVRATRVHAPTRHPSVPERNRTAPHRTAPTHPRTAHRPHALSCPPGSRAP